MATAEELRSSEGQHNAGQPLGDRSAHPKIPEVKIFLENPSNEASGFTAYFLPHGSGISQVVTIPAGGFAVPDSEGCGGITGGTDSVRAVATPAGGDETALSSGDQPVVARGPRFSRWWRLRGENQIGRHRPRRMATDAGSDQAGVGKAASRIGVAEEGMFGMTGRTARQPLLTLVRYMNRDFPIPAFCGVTGFATGRPHAVRMVGLKRRSRMAAEAAHFAAVGTVFGPAEEIDRRSRDLSRRSGRGQRIVTGAVSGGPAGLGRRLRGRARNTWNQERQQDPQPEGADHQ